MDSPVFAHRLPDFEKLISASAAKHEIEFPQMVEKDYWIMHCLWGLQQGGYAFHLKGGTSLSKGYGLIKRFSEDIDIQIDPPDEIEVGYGASRTDVESRKAYYD